MAASNYGSVVDTTKQNEQYRSRSQTKVGGDQPKICAIATSIILLFISVILFIYHIRHNPPPLLGSSWYNMNSEHQQQSIPDPYAYPRRPFITKHGSNIAIPVIGFPSVALANYPDPKDQVIANEAVRHAVEDLQIGYFDVAPEYGDGTAQSRLGPALKPYRQNVFLAAKTMFRDSVGSAADLDNTLKALQTDHLDLYQFHSISTEQDVEEILGKNGAMETFQLAKRQGRIRAIGFSAHSESMAVRMIGSGMVDTCMFPINFSSYHYGNVGKKLLDAAIKNNVGVIALKAGARGRLTNENGEAVHVPNQFKHIPEWKRQEMIDYPVVTSPKHHTWYEPEDDPAELNRLILWSLNQKGVTAVLPPGSLVLLDGIANMLRERKEVPEFNNADMEHMLERYKTIVPIFHNRSISGTKVST